MSRVNVTFKKQIIQDSKLTVSEKKVLWLLSEGHTLESAAKRLFLARSTVKTHTENIRHKLKAQTTAHAVGIAYRERIFEVE